MSKPALVFRLGFVQSEERLNTPFLFAKYCDKRKFYSCNQDFNYVSYVNQGSKQKIDYVAYSGNKEKSTGVFNEGGLLTAQQQAELKKRLRETKSIIWDGVIAFQQDFGNKYMCGYEEAVGLLTAELPRFFKSAGLNPENMTWYAGLHENTRYKHIHISFFENEPQRFTQRGGDEKNYSGGYISKAVLDHFKIAVQQRLTDVTAELKLARKNLTDLAKEVLFSDKNKESNLTEIQEQIADLIPLLPETGRLSYDSDNMEPLRPNIRRVVDLLIKSSSEIYHTFTELCDAAMRRDANTREMLLSQKIDEKYWSSYMTTEKVVADVYRRLGNYVINTTRNFKEKEKHNPDGKTVPNNQPGSNNRRMARKWAKKKTTKAVFSYCLRLNAEIEQEALNAFREYMEKLKKSEKDNEVWVMESDEME